MSIRTRKVDAKARVTLPDAFAGRSVTVDRVGDHEVLVRMVKTPRRVPSLQQLLAGVTEANLHGAIDFGPPVGNEVL